MLNLPFYLTVLFVLTVVAAFFLFFRASGRSATFVKIALGWLAIQTLVSLSGFYLNTGTLPPRFLGLILPPVVLIALLFITPSGRRFIDSLDLSALTQLHSIRFFVELVLFGLFSYHYVPELMTFEGRNLDILSGLSAPLVHYFVFVKKSWNTRLLIFWNVVCLGLLANIVFHAVLSVDTPFQQFAFDQPNRAVLYFPFTFLPAFLVPLVLFSHLAALRQLLHGRTVGVLSGSHS